MPRSYPATGAARIENDRRTYQTLCAQVRLLYSSATAGVCVTIIASAILAYLQWGIGPSRFVFGWWFYMTGVSISRYILTRYYHRLSGVSTNIRKWGMAFAIGSALAGLGWGGAAVFLYRERHLANQVFLTFVIGGMMLGAASLLAPRVEAFLVFLIPAGLAPTVRLLMEGDETHLAMGLLAGLFTIVTLLTTARIHGTIVSSINVQFENRDLVEDLRAAKNQAEALNQVLELRVQERTAELQRSTERLRKEMVERRQMEEELLRTRKLESLGVLAGGVAHDFNNFLTVIQGNIELAARKLPSTHPIQKCLTQSENMCHRAALLSSQLLTFAKGGAPVRRVVPSSELVMDAVNLARAGTAVRIDASIPENLFSVYVDPVQIGQVLHNIFVNARQAMPNGGTIEVCAENVVLAEDSGECRVRVAIQDHGFGISADVLPRIFDPYFTTRDGGSGLGLATAYSIIAKHDGRILVESTPGSGTVFTVELPASTDTPALNAPMPSKMHPASGRILVMDDEDAVRTLLETILTDLGYDVRTARDGADALALYERAKTDGKGFDAVLLDLTVSGGMGGIEAAAKLKEVDPKSKLIVSSGYSDAAALSEFARYGFDGVIPKPWTTADLAQVLHQLLFGDVGRSRGVSPDSLTDVTPCALEFDAQNAFSARYSFGCSGSAPCTFSAMSAACRSSKHLTCISGK